MQVSRTTRCQWLTSKTSDAETMALDAYINAAKNRQAQGKDPTYWVGFRDCIWFCSNGLQKEGIGGGSSIHPPDREQK